MIKKIDSKNSLYFKGCDTCDGMCCSSNLIYTSLWDIHLVFKHFPIFFLRSNNSISIVYFFYYGEKEDTRCLYLKNTMCSIYENRPYACRTYPFEFSKDKFGYNDGCHYISDEQIGMPLIENKTVNPKIIDNFVTDDFISYTKSNSKKSKEFVHFLMDNDLLIPYETFYKNKDISKEFKPSLSQDMFVIHPFKIAALRLNKQKLFDGKDMYLRAVQQIIASQDNMQKLYDSQNSNT